MIGFETIGNATLICHDGRPVLATDPWTTGSAYFGNWILTHDIPEEQLEHIRQCEYVWLSHGHPDHVSAESLEPLCSKKFLLPDHAAGRIHNDLRAAGFSVSILKDGEWVRLSDRIKVMCFGDYNQDAVLLIDLNGRLLLNVNDAGDGAWGRTAKKLTRQYPVSFLLKMFGFGDADMINFYEEDGVTSLLPKDVQSRPLGKAVQRAAERYGVRYVIPFSAFHQHQRTDGAWMNNYIVPLPAFARGFQSKTAELLPAFIVYDCELDRISEINPPERSAPLRAPEEFGDNWSEELGIEEAREVHRYFSSIESLADHVDFLNFKVGGRVTGIRFGTTSGRRGLTFEAPRHSLMTAVRCEVFEDLLISNLMKGILHGDWGRPRKSLNGRLYPYFTPYVKYAENGRARSKAELSAYFRAYRARGPLDFVLHRLKDKSVAGFRNIANGRSGRESIVFRATKKAYHFLRVGH